MSKLNPRGGKQLNSLLPGALCGGSPSRIALAYEHGQPLPVAHSGKCRCRSVEQGHQPT